MSYSENAMIAFVMSIWLILVSFYFGFFVLNIVARWRILEKAQEPGWKSLIPYYNTYMLFKISWKGKVYFLLLLSYILGLISWISLGAILPNSDFLVFCVLIFLVFVPSIINIGLWVKLSKSFGMGIAFAIGLIILNLIFIMILAFGSSEYKRSIDNIETQKSCQ